jgi:hypothetical protein
MRAIMTAPVEMSLCPVPIPPHVSASDQYAANVLAIIVGPAPSRAPRGEVETTV